jgi:hypothetical protein
MALRIARRIDCVLIGAGLYLTKPNLASFNTWYDTMMIQSCHTFGERAAVWAARGITNVEFVDIGLFSFVNVSIPGCELRFIGVLGSWFPIHTKNK